jgi:hypothetical protein
VGKDKRLSKKIKRAKKSYNMKEKKIEQEFKGFSPESSGNFWKYPRIMDKHWHKLSGSEQKVLDYILRRTWGFDKIADEISLTQLENGIKNLDEGTGLSRPTIIKAVDSLIKKGFITKKHGKKANHYELVKNLNYPSKNSLPLGSKNSLHTINRNTINNKQYSSLSKKEKIEAYKKRERFDEKPYYRNEEMRWCRDKWWVIPKEGGSWLEFADSENKIEWKKK